MTSKERIMIAMKGGQPDCVPVAPDMSNMIPYMNIMITATKSLSDVKKKVNI